MNRQELANEILQLKYEKEIDEKILIRPEFILQSEYRYLDDAFQKVKHSGEKWHQFVRFILAPKEEWKYMYERLAYLLKIHRNSLNDYFVLKSGTESNSMPDRMTDFIRFHGLYEEFARIYSKIIRQMQVDHPSIDYTGKIIRGKINWKETLFRSKDKFPLNFEMTTWSRDFSTPENILLFLSLNWLNKESTKIINTAFSEPLHSDEIQILQNVESSTNQLIRNFPYQAIIQSSKQFSKLLPKDNEISQLMEYVKFRAKHGDIRNKTYLELLEWIRKIKELSMEFLTGNPTRFHIDSLSDLDTVYEAWIFLELLDFCKFKKHLDVTLTLGKVKNDPTFFEFVFDGHVIRMNYEKQFQTDNKEAWILKHTPDFSVFCDDILIGIFDAKNYSKESEKATGINKMLSYLVNLDSNYGALFFPKIQNQDAYVLKNASHHNELTLVHYQMNPIESPNNIQIKYDSLEMVFSAIIGRIQITKNM
ncbi:MAG: hypothetical protein OEL81_00395 [Nitrosopumilus sp.]|nr:hypothetical protein [Nitrosopumilus sp.]